MSTKKISWVYAFISICLFAGTCGVAWATSSEVISGPVTISFQGAGPGEFDYYDNGASGNYLQTSPVAIPAQITAVSPMDTWNALLPTTSLPADINFGLSGNGSYMAASVNDNNNTFSQILNIQWGADFSNTAGILSIVGTTPLTIYGSLNGTNATIQGSFDQMSFYQSGMPVPISLSQPELLTINVNATTPLTIDQQDQMLSSFTGDWGGGLAPQTAVPEPSEALTYVYGFAVLSAFLAIEWKRRRGVSSLSPLG